MAADAPKTFVSYSRDDYDFVARLAEDLKNAGARIWLDKLDISPGTAWDNSVRDGLKKSPRVLVVLSPSSVKSENVLDEIAFALDNRKLVIPVLYRECEPPLRLNRLQYIDFRLDYERGLSGLLASMGLAKLLQAQTTESVPTQLMVEKIESFAVAKERINDALRVLEKRLPPDQLYDFETMVDLVRDHLPNKRVSSFEMYFLVAAYQNHCLGMLMGWRDATSNFCFVSYMAATKNRAPGSPGDVSKQLADGVLKTLNSGAANSPPRFIFEIDDPATAENKEQRRHRLSRLRLFHDLAPFESVHLRVLDVPYLQPSVEWPPTGPEKQLLLCYAAPGLHTWLPKTEVVEILAWVYTQLYEGRAFGDLAARAAFQAHNRELLDSVVSRLPERVGLLKYRDLEKRRVRP